MVVLSPDFNSIRNLVVRHEEAVFFMLLRDGGIVSVLRSVFQLIDMHVKAREVVADAAWRQGCGFKT